MLLTLYETGFSKGFEEMIYSCKCSVCDQEIESLQYLTSCPSCGGEIVFDYDYDLINLKTKYRSMWRYKDLMPLTSEMNIVSLSEGLTPLTKSKLPFKARLYLKDETKNPTGSVKDRAMSLAVSKAKELGFTNLLAASTGSVGLSLAAYGAQAGCRTTILVPKHTPEERLVPMALFGAKVLEIDGIYEEGMRWMDQAKTTSGWYVASTYRRANPYQSEATKTIAYEILEELGKAPNLVVAPVGGGGTLVGIWNGFLDLKRMGRIDRLPQIFGVQVEKYSLLHQALRHNISDYHSLSQLSTTYSASAQTVAINLAHILPPDGVELLRAIRESGGDILVVTDEETVASQKRLAMTDSVFCEPSSAVVVAALAELEERMLLTPDTDVVLILTGSGLRELGAAARLHPLEKRRVSPQLEFEEIIS